MFWFYLTIIVSIILFSILNRLRGTGLIKEFGTLHIFKWDIKVKLVWNHVYGLYIAFIAMFFYNPFTVDINLYFTEINDYKIGYTSAFLMIFTGYILGESKGWGEWVGALTSHDKEHTYVWLIKQYTDDEGKKFPYVHYIANLIVKEQSPDTWVLEKRVAQYLTYARVALAIRGMVWWLPVYGAMMFLEIINWENGVASIILNGLTFPIACNIGKYTSARGKLGVINWSPGWENQELIYGFYTGIFFWIAIILSNINI